MTTKLFSNKQESMIAKYLGWDTVSGSGARHFNKGDVVSSTWLGECKTHMKPGCDILFMLEHWVKIVREAQESLRAPVLFVDDGSQTADKTWCMYSHVSNPIEDCCHVTLPISYQTNIIFSHDQLIQKYNEQSRISDNTVIFTTTFNGKEVRILPLNQFKLLFRGMLC